MRHFRILGMSAALWLMAALPAAAALPTSVIPATTAANITASAPTVINVPNALGTPYLQVLIGNFARILVGISGSIALLVFVWAGITMMRANGDPALVKKGKDMMVWTAAGLLIIFASEALVRAVLSALFTGSAT